MPASPAFRRRSSLQREINQAPSPLIAVAVPLFSVLLASLAPVLPLVASAPVMPPLGFMVMLAWFQLRPGLFPVWAGFPLGLFDDLFSGQPFGSAMLLWSLAAIFVDLLEHHFPWRGVSHEWLVGAGLIAVFLFAQVAIVDAAGGRVHPLIVLPQLVVSVLLYPLVARAVGALDRLRLVRVRVSP